MFKCLVSYHTVIEYHVISAMESNVEKVWLWPLMNSMTEAGGKMPGYHLNAVMSGYWRTENERPIRTGRVKDGSIEEVRVSCEEIVPRK